MPANITMTNGKAEMAYAGQAPWHKLGTRVDGLMTAEQALQAANMDWEVTMAPLYLSNGQEVPTHRATYRSDTETVLSVVGSRYTPVQNRSWRWSSVR